ncbi:MAG: hypothetical protein A2074_05820 [Candidatus Aquicultor primus]|uniref:DUF3786 domain-containing protein n=1 Tax=Candidatus Aquicultor primus TaxID=1797195 RepID=A0A1F2UPY8_9ACTN|nr:MAG: hypothetical protein A2074_05820 [Candidatus Aquicultor primus]HCG99373.1 hypothetical protein [Actinomycetota bacterium]
MDNYELVLSKLIERLAKFNYAIVGDRTGAEFDLENESLRVRFLGQDYCVTKTDCKPLGGHVDDTKDVILIVDYLLSFGSFDAGDDWIDFRDLPGSMPYDGAFRVNVEMVLEKHVPDIIEHKGELASEFDGYDAVGFSNADFAVVFQVFPRVDCLVLLCAGDDEIGAGAKLLFSSKAQHYLTTESLAAIGETLTRRISGHVS